jgi:ABC-type lipoprotein export system ATPase subunit/GNAT superfamily N-acetyltransferase
MSIFEKYDLTDVDESFPIPLLPDNGIVLIVGASGTGKSTILRHYFGNLDGKFDERTSLIELFEDEAIGEQALIAAGLRSIPAWRRPLSQLSNGERHRAEIALKLSQSLYVFDEFTSVVDRDTAKSLCVAMRKHFERHSIQRVVVATCHRDVAMWLTPDHIYDTDYRRYLARGCLHRPHIRIEITPCDPKDVWPFFRRHHYLSSKINHAANAWVAKVGDTLVGFTSILAFPNGNMKNAWREHRTVVVPEWQGMGIGNAISETIASEVVRTGYRFFSKTAHPAMGEHRNHSALWRPTSKNGIRRHDYAVSRVNKEAKYKMLHAHRMCYSHEYIGGSTTLLADLCRKVIDSGTKQ